MEPSTSTEVMDPAAVQEALRKQADSMKAKIGAPSGDKIKLTKQKEFVLPNGVKSAAPLRVVVVDFVAYNAYYDRPFSEKDKTPPACFALGAVKPRDLVPSASSPAKQGEKCQGCPLNEFGSKGAGKACGNHYLLGVVEPTGDPKSPLYIIQCSPKSTKHWENYSNGILMQRGTGVIGVTTEIYFDENETSQVLRFGNPEANQFAGVHLARQPTVLRRLLAEPDVSGYTALPKGRSR